MNRHQYIHFVGIGGYGMSGIANILLHQGFRVSGSDLKRNDLTDRLAALGARICTGHQAENVEDAQALVISSAIAAENAEVRVANDAGIPVYSRAEMLQFIIECGIGVAVAGTHGKTSTTSMISCILERAGVDPTVVIGGEVTDFGGNSKFGFGPHVVVEADESDGSFLFLKPRYAVVTNIDNDHMDYYRDLRHLRQTFASFLGNVDPDGVAALCSDCANVRMLLPMPGRNILTYGFDPAHAVYVASDHRKNGVGGSFELHRRSRRIGRIELAVPGRHNVLNATAAAAIALELDVPFAQIADALGRFGGAVRRFQRIGECAGVRVFDDYGHHPTEIRATLEAADGVRIGRVVAVFQPHRFTRTMNLHEDFAAALMKADFAVIDDIYPASEAPIPGVTSELVVEGMRRLGHPAVHHIAGQNEIVDFLAGQLTENDLVLTIGAGSVTALGPKILDRLSARRPAPAVPRAGSCAA